MVAALVISFALQVALAVHSTGRLLGADSPTYVRIAASFSDGSLLSGDALDQGYWPAGYPLVMSILDATSPDRVLPVQLLQALLVTAMALMVFDILRPISNRVAFLGLCLIAFSPAMIAGALAVGYEILLGFFLTAAVWVLWPTAFAVRLPLRPLIAGALAGLALTIQFKMVVIVPVLLYLAWRMRERRWAPFELAIGAAIPPLLWSVRNATAFGAFRPWTSNGPINVWIGNGPHATGAYVTPPPIADPSSLAYLRAAVNWAFLDPNAFARLQFAKVANLFSPPEADAFGLSLPELLKDVLTWALWLWPLSLGLLLGLFVAAWLLRVGDELAVLRPFAVIAIIGLAVNVPFFGEGRFRTPVEPMLAVVAAATAHVVWQRWSGRVGKSTPSAP